MKNKTKFQVAGVTGLLSILLVILIRAVDVASIGPEGTDIGLSHINKAIFEFFEVDMLWYNITDWLGVVAILMAFLFAFIGFGQMINRRSLLKVDRSILALGVLYIIVIGLYILFEIAIVNYRPIIMPGCEHPEASFPSSHTMMVCVIMGSAMMLLKRYINNRPLRLILQVLCIVLILVTVFGRLISGVHWFTDIIGGVLISVSLLSLYAGVLEAVIEKEVGHGAKTAKGMKAE
ncbi:phosphatase PAP2 family protein [Acetivibrio mesophilus]|nr:phosphatase PAP2 family protein [Acetivibrio mesophilus]ODM26308.1 hypothetical protein A7W90_08770 [Clostridium sp. Bc-iso-3]HHV30362.1 phosphatase PAP2 family protein [Clostridium sp.]